MRELLIEISIGAVNLTERFLWKSLYGDVTIRLNNLLNGTILDHPVYVMLPSLTFAANRIIRSRK